MWVPRMRAERVFGDGGLFGGGTVIEIPGSIAEAVKGLGSSVMAIVEPSIMIATPEGASDRV